MSNLDPNSPESIERTMLDPTQRISATTAMPQPIDDLVHNHGMSAGTAQAAEPAAASSADAGTNAAATVADTAPGRPGPAPLSLVFGLLLLASAALMGLHQAVDLRVDWDVAGPIALVGGGVVLALLGAVGLRRRS